MPGISQLTERLAHAHSRPQSTSLLRMTDSDVSRAQETKALGSRMAQAINFNDMARHIMQYSWFSRDVIKILNPESRAP